MYSTYEYTNFSDSIDVIKEDAKVMLYYVGPSLVDDPKAHIDRLIAKKTIRFCNITLSTDLLYSLQNAKRGDKIYEFRLNLLHSLNLEHTPISNDALASYLGDGSQEADSRYSSLLEEPFRSGRSIKSIPKCQPFNEKGGDSAARFLFSQGVGHILHEEGVNEKGEIYFLNLTVLDPSTIESVRQLPFWNLRPYDYDVKYIKTPYLPTLEAATLHYKKHLIAKNKVSTREAFEFNEQVILIGAYALARLNTKGEVYFSATEKPNTPIQSEPLWNDVTFNWFSHTNKILLPSSVFDFNDRAVKLIPAFMLEEETPCQ